MIKCVKIAFQKALTLLDYRRNGLLTVLIWIPHCKSDHLSLHALNKSAFKLLVLLVTLLGSISVLNCLFLKKGLNKF